MLDCCVGFHYLAAVFDCCHAALDRMLVQRPLLRVWGGLGPARPTAAFDLTLFACFILLLCFTAVFERCLERGARA